MAAFHTRIQNSEEPTHSLLDDAMKEMELAELQRAT